MKKFTLCLISFYLGACASVNSLSLTTVPAQRSTQITAEASKFIFLGFNFNNDFVDDAIQQLKTKCPNGVISGILTKDEVISYFLAHTRKVTATGYCSTGTEKHALNGTFQ